MNTKEKLRIVLETWFVAIGLIIYFIGGFYFMHEAQLALKSIFGGH
jgi:hypothetical protein